MLTLLVFDRSQSKVLTLEEFKDEDEAYSRHMENVEKYGDQDAVTVELIDGSKKQLLEDFPWYSQS